MRPIFVCGNSRSGTTVMARALSRAKYTYMFDELHYYDEIRGGKVSAQLDSLYSRYKLGYFEGKKRLIEYPWHRPDGDETLIKLFFDNVASDQLAEILIEQTPASVDYIEQINRDFPQVKIIVMVRDYRDVVLSQLAKWKRKFKGAKTIPWSEVVRAYFNANVILIAKMWDSKYSRNTEFLEFENVILVRYEDLIKDPASVMARVCNFIEVEFSGNLLEVEVKGSSTECDSEARGFLITNTEKWRSLLPYCDQVVADTICGKTASTFGYESGRHSVIVKLFAFTLSFGALLLKFPFIMLFNQHRLRAFVKKLVNN
jgi:hypothetical protein